MASSFATLATIQFPSPAHLLASSWCPDKDLLVVIIRLSGKDRLSLWKMQGSKKWEVDIDTGSLVAVTWSPDGQTIAVAHEPPQIILYSIQDGREERILPVSPPMSGRTLHLTGIWWFKEQKVENRSNIPDIFKRGADITGSAHSILKCHPLLDPLQDDSQPLTASDLFAFQGTHPHASPKSSLPSVISTWPTLTSDPYAASIQPSRIGEQKSRPGEDLDEIDESNINSILAVSDDAGHLHCFLDGSYPLGTISLGAECSPSSLYKAEDFLFAHLQSPNLLNISTTTLRPLVVQLPYLKQRALRDVAKVSSSVRELVWYMIRVVKDMRGVWFGSETQNGARELGPKWVRALEARQKDEFGQEEPYAMLDLTCLLTTGRASESLADFLGSGDQMSERGLQKWESTVVEALTKLRDFAERRVVPACQRLHILLEEVQGWSQLSQYALCRIQPSEVQICLDLTSRAVVVASWLAATTRKELVHFKEFMIWLKYETSRVNSPADAHNYPPPRHDILEANDYLISGLVVSPIDKWFMGPVPQFLPHELGVPEEQCNLRAVMERARSVLKDRNQLTWQYNVKQKDLSHLDRNLDSLIQELAARCQKIFVESANATARSAIVVSGAVFAPSLNVELSPAVKYGRLGFMRERTVPDGNQPGNFLQYLAIQMPHVGDRTHLCLARMHHGLTSTPSPFRVRVAVLECCIQQEGAYGGVVPLDLLDVEFFDDSSLVLVYRIGGRDGQASIATVGYADLTYQPIELRGYVNDLAREALMSEVTQRLQDGQLTSVHVPIIQSRSLAGCRKGKVTLAVNGRVGRRVACVLDDSGLALEILDMEGEEDEAEEMAAAET
ncbi:hypothetical protein AcW1_000598 [Taiwanofungus camphoratus]|nr:hypothetical protein AcW2_000906 [Antrodia cinnamomea]KAI0936330.1 hypothetical protein AcV5_004497 [Antrodia cinnamomea]KAI0963553.1 hypothetical protein AcW1_000598 [Antrodia cinnamomea]